ncbi:MAG: hypothetical protein AAF525_13490 [Pseudomonadota bacterium]
MSDDLIASDQLLTDAQKHLLVAVLDTLIPASGDHDLPSAGNMDFAKYLAEHAPEEWPVVISILNNLKDSFADDAIARRVEQLESLSVSEPRLFGGLLRQVYACYYMQPSVLNRIGAGSGAPYPRGNTVEAGDLSLLDPVMSSTITWRRS